MARYRKRLYLIDGYNVLRSGSSYRDIDFEDYTDDTYNVAREKLINDTLMFCDAQSLAIIVFDGGRNVYSTGKSFQYGRLRVLFSPRGKSADQVLESLSYKAKETGLEITVVSSDAAIQDTVFGGSVNRMSAEGFCREIELLRGEAQIELGEQRNAKRILSERIDAGSLEKLINLRDGFSSV